MECDTTLDTTFDAGLTPLAWWKMATRSSGGRENAPERVEYSPTTYDLPAIAHAPFGGAQLTSPFYFLGLSVFQELIHLGLDGLFVARDAENVALAAEDERM